ncbi:hypothetical protein cypCar_00041325, partial [Cyprinus carpio]
LHAIQSWEKHDILDMTVCAFLQRSCLPHQLKRSNRQYKEGYKACLQRIFCDFLPPVNLETETVRFR